MSVEDAQSAAIVSYMIGSATTNGACLGLLEAIVSTENPSHAAEQPAAKRKKLVEAAAARRAFAAAGAAAAGAFPNCAAVTACPCPSLFHNYRHNLDVCPTSHHVDGAHRAPLLPFRRSDGVCAGSATQHRPSGAAISTSHRCLIEPLLKAPLPPSFAPSPGQFWCVNEVGWMVAAGIQRADPALPFSGGYCARAGHL